MKGLLRKAIRVLGYDISRRDRLAELIPADYPQSPFLPTISRGQIHKISYYKEMVERTAHLSGDIVECGVSIGQGTLLFLLLSEYVGVKRSYWGFDSFEGFPEPDEKDGVTPIKDKEFYANPPEVVLKTLSDGRIPARVIEERVRLVKGWFDETLQTYNGEIALLHLDCDLYGSYLTCLSTLYSKVIPGGVIMFDEYNDERWPGATKAIDEFFADRPETVRAHERCDWKYFVVKT